jgi:hypothetical protein
MDSQGYRLAITDRAFAFDGAYRAPTSISAADRAAYGLRDSSPRQGNNGFAIALHKASKEGQTAAIRMGKRCLTYYKGCPTSNPPRRQRTESPENGIVRRFPIRAGRRWLPHYKASAASETSTVPFSTVRAAIGDVALQVVALRGRVFIGVHNKCLTPK